MNLRFILLLLAILTMGCAQKFIVQSDPPEAEVYIREVGGKDKVFIGKTPLEMTGHEFKIKTKHDVTDGSFVEMLIEKNGFMTDRMLIPASRFNTASTKIFSKMRGGVDEASFASKMIEHLKHAQNFVEQNDLVDADTEIDRALEIDDHFASALSVKGTILYLQKRYSQSLSYFEKALEYDEHFDEAVKMIAKIKHEHGDRLPAGHE